MAEHDRLISESEYERTLVLQLREGDPRAFATLMHLYANRLSRFAYYIVGSRDAAEDIVQQVFVELWERRSSLAPERLKPYLFRAIRYKALDERKRQGVRDRYRESQVVVTETPMASEAIPSEEDQILTVTAIQTAVRKLPKRRQLAIRLRLEDEMTHAEIADVLGVSIMAAQRLVARAMADLRELLLEKQ